MTLLRFALLVVPVCLFTVFVLLAIRRGWRSIRLISAAFTVWSSLTVLILLLPTWDRQLLALGLGLSITVGLSILSWPITAPQIMKRLDLKW